LYCVTKYGAADWRRRPLVLTADWGFLTLDWPDCRASATGVRREKAALSSGCNPRQPLQPEATGAVMEVGGKALDDVSDDLVTVANTFTPGVHA
jgi:hypothetical protein